MKDNLYKKQFLTEHNFKKSSAKLKILIIASTGRSGSHMLGHTLHSTGKFGFPLEYFQKNNLNKWKEIINKNNIKDIICSLQDIRTSENGVFSIKIHYSQVKEIGGFTNLQELLPNAYFVFIKRRNILKQAVSMSIARQTGIWISEQLGNGRKPKYDYCSINMELKELLKDNSNWIYHLESSNSNYISLDFEDVRDNLDDSVIKISNFMNIELKDEEIPIIPLTKKQTNSVNDDFLSKYLSDYNNKHSYKCFFIEYVVAVKKNIRNFINVWVG